MSDLKRHAYIDWARGIAVLIMIEAHTTDAWTRAADKTTIAYGYLSILGGFAAPLFLWLAGLGVALSAARTASRTGSRIAALHAVCRRGLEIFILAFVFRLQAFIVSPGSHPVTLFRVDVLNVMGLSMVAAGLLWASSSRSAARAVVLGSAAAFVALVTPIVRASPSVDLLPTWGQWYVRPSGEHTTFTLFPWSGFVFAGAAAGAILAEAQRQARERPTHVVLGFVGMTVVALGFYTAAQPSIYVASSFWTSSPTWFAIRVGTVMTAVVLLSALPADAFTWSGSDLLAVLGRSSLFVYWIHVELVYGYASWLWRQRLPVWGWAMAFAAFTMLMYRAIGWRDALVIAWRERQRPAVAPNVMANG